MDGALLGEMADVHGRLTLDELITGVWEGLAVRGAVECPVCASPMALMLVAMAMFNGWAPVSIVAQSSADSPRVVADQARNEHV